MRSRPVHPKQLSFLSSLLAAGGGAIEAPSGSRKADVRSLSVAREAKARESILEQLLLTGLLRIKQKSPDE